MKSQPGFFSFRWRSTTDVPAADDIAVVFKVAGSVDMAVLPDLIEAVCLGPVVPSAVVLVQLKQDGTLLPALDAPSVKNALMRFNGRMPFAVVTVDLKSLSVSISRQMGLTSSQVSQFQSKFREISDWVEAGLGAVFKPEEVIVPAPPGFAFLKPSGRRSSFFLRADMALATSSAVSFVAFAIFSRLLKAYTGIPRKLKILYVDTMSVVSTAFALREMLALVGVSPLPQVESFHSYDGIHSIASPLPDTSLCIVSASSSMGLQREWISSKSLSARDIVTLVTFEGVKGADQALYSLPAAFAPDELKPSAKYDIHVKGELFFPVMEEARKVLLTTTHHGCKELTDVFNEYRGASVFGAFRTANKGETRRGLFIDAAALFKQQSFRIWVNDQLPQLLKLGTTQVLAQDDEASIMLAQHIAHIVEELSGVTPTILRAAELSTESIDRQGSLICVAAIVGKGNSILALSRDLRNLHFGSRVYVIGAQVTESLASINTFDKNLCFSSRNASIQVARMLTCLSSSSVVESFDQELSLLQQLSASSVVIEKRIISLRQGLKPDSLFWASGKLATEELQLNKDFSFWKNNYEAGCFHGEVLGTISTILQNARTAALRQEVHRLRSPLLKHVTLDPENFSRFNEGVIHASLLRAALPSELDYRGDSLASEYMAEFLVRMASRFDQLQQATLEFLVAIAIGRLQLNEQDLKKVQSGFGAHATGTSEMSKTVRILLASLPGDSPARVAF